MLLAPAVQAQTGSGAASVRINAAGFPGVPALADPFVNGVKGGTVAFFVDESGAALLPVITVKRILAGVVKPELLSKIVGSSGYVSEGDLEPIGIILDYDSAALTLKFTVSPRAMAPQDIGMLVTPVRPTGGTSFIPEVFSAVLGTAIRIDPAYDFGPDGGPSVLAELSLDPAMRLFGFVAEGGFDLGLSAVGWATLREARLSYDFPRLGARAAFGTLESRSVFFQSTANLVGLSFSSEDSLPGGKTHNPSSFDEILLYRPAEISVEINGAVVRRLHVAPGSYRLSELPLATGLNTVTVRIEEEGSPPRVVNLGVSFDGGVLPTGQLDYALDIGLDSTSLEHPIGLAHISVGVTPSLELGVDASATLDGVLAGASALWASPIGSLEASGGLSLVSDGVSPPAFGDAGRLDWRLMFPANPYIPMLGAGIQYRSQLFAAPGDLAVASSVATLLLSSQVSQLLPWGFGSLAVFGNLGFAANQLQSYSLSAGLFFHLSNTASLSVSGGADFAVGSGLQPRASISLSIIPQPKQTVMFRRDLLAGDESIQVSAPLDPQQRTVFAASEEGLLSQTGNAGSAWLSTTYTGDTADLSAAASYQTTPQNGASQVALHFTGSSTFAYAGGFFGASSNLGDAFLFLVPATSIRTDTVVLQPVNGPAAVSENGKPTLVPRLTPYEDLAATVEMPGSPPERRPQPETALIQSAYRSGTVVRIKAAPAMSARGRLVDQKGTALTGHGGKFFRNENKTLLVGETFSDEKGIFECYGLEAGDYVVEWTDGSQSRFTIEGESTTIIELGNVTDIPGTQGGRH